VFMCFILLGLPSARLQLPPVRELRRRRGHRLLHVVPAPSYMLLRTLYRSIGGRDPAATGLVWGYARSAASPPTEPASWSGLKVIDSSSSAWSPSASACSFSVRSVESALPRSGCSELVRPGGRTSSLTDRDLRAVRRQVGGLGRDPHALAVAGGVVARGRGGKLIVIVTGRRGTDEDRGAVETPGSEPA
jgi:hypothetical protein